MHTDSWAWKMLLQVLGVCVLQEVQAVTTFVSSSEAPSWRGKGIDLVQAVWGN